MGVELALAGFEVTLIARGPHLEAMRKNGLKLLIAGESKTARIPSTDDPSQLGPQDYVILALKAHSVSPVVDQIASFMGSETAVVTAIGKSISLEGIQEGTYVARVFGVAGAKNRYELEIDAPSTATNSLDDWTLMVYMTASTLFGPAERDLNELEALVATLPGTVNVAVLLDQSTDLSTEQFATGGGTQAPWSDTGRVILQGDRDRNVVGTTFELLGEQNTGDPNNLSSFVQWAAGERPAKNYGLIFWGHGFGIAGTNIDDVDAPDPVDRLEMEEIATALGILQADGIDFELIGFDSSLMGMAIEPGRAGR